MNLQKGNVTMKKLFMLTAMLLMAMLFGLVACQPATGGDETTDGESVTTTPYAPDSETSDPDTDPAEQPTEAPADPADTDPAETDPPETESPDYTPVEVPLPEGYETADNVYECADDSFVHWYQNKSAEDYAAVCAFYKEQGYGVYMETTMGENLSATFTHKGGMAHVYWHKNASELSIAVSRDAAATLPPKTPAVTDGDVACTVAQMNIPGGMGYVVQLKDGSYIVVDGGYTKDAATLFNYLLDNRKGSDKPIIRAWILTHSHEDHIETFIEFAKNTKYHERITLERVIVSPLDADVFDLDENNVNSQLTYRLADYAAEFEGAKVIFAHTGMEFAFCDLKMEILCTPENLKRGCSGTEYNTNELSIVFRLKADGYTVMFWGDLMDNGGRFLVNTYGDYIQSDMLHASHHGIDNMSAYVYDHVRAPILFYPVDQANYDTNALNYDVRRHVQDAEYTKEILIASLGLFVRPWGYEVAADAELSMPNYTPPADMTPEVPGDPNLEYIFSVPIDWAGQRFGNVTIGRCSQGPAYNWIKFSKRGCLYIGDYDLSKVGSIVYDVTGQNKNWVYDYPDAHTLRFCKDSGGKEIIAEIDMVTTSGYGVEIFEQTIRIHSDYNGPLYVYLNCETGHEYLISNLKFYKKTEADTEPAEPDTEESETEPAEPGFTDGLLTEDEMLGLTEKGDNTGVNRSFSNFPGVTFIKFEPTNGNGWINLGYVDLSKYASMTYEATGSTIDWHSRTDINNGEHYFTFCSDAEGNNVLFRVHLGNINSGVLTEMTADLAGINYVGNLYMHIETQIGGRYYGITNMQFHAGETVEPEPDTTEPETDPVEPETDPVEPEPAEPALSDGILSEEELLALTEKGSNTTVGKTFSSFPETAFIKFEPTSGNGWINLGYVDLSKFASLTYEVVGSTLDWHSRTDVNDGGHYITFCSDAEGTNVVFRVHMGNVKSGEFTEMTADLAGIDYAGNLYMHIETTIGGRYYGITNMQLHTA